MFSGYVYLRAGGGDDASLFLVERSLIESLPSGWFAQTFGRSAMAPPETLHRHHDLPVYGVPTTAAIFGQLLMLLRFPQLLRKARNKVPRAIEATVDFEQWHLSLEYFGFNEWNVVGDDDDEEDMEERAAKRLKIEQCAPVRIAFFRRMIAPLAAAIKNGHPRWEAFATGRISAFDCQFIHDHAPPWPGLSYDLGLPKPIYVAVALASANEREHEVLCAMLLDQLAPAIKVTYTTDRVRWDKKVTTRECWPSTGPQYDGKPEVIGADVQLTAVTMTISF